MTKPFAERLSGEWKTEKSMIDSGQEKEIFLLFRAYRSNLDSAQPPIYFVMGLLIKKVKRPKHVADHSPLSVLRLRMLVVTLLTFS